MAAAWWSITLTERQSDERDLISIVVETLAFVIVVLAGIWLVGLAAGAFFKPNGVKEFFDKFASSAFAHFVEMFLRLVAGASFIIYAPHMTFSTVFKAFGWLLIGTTAVLIFVPWKLHRKFADRSLPIVTDRMWLFGLFALLVGFAILSSLLIGQGS